LERRCTKDVLQIKIEAVFAMLTSPLLATDVR